MLMTEQPRTSYHRECSGASVDTFADHGGLTFLVPGGLGISWNPTDRFPVTRVAEYLRSPAPTSARSTRPYIALGLGAGRVGTPPATDDASLSLVTRQIAACHCRL